METLKWKGEAWNPRVLVPAAVLTFSHQAGIFPDIPARATARFLSDSNDDSDEDAANTHDVLTAYCTRGLYVRSLHSWRLARQSLCHEHQQNLKQGPLREPLGVAGMQSQVHGLLLTSRGLHHVHKHARLQPFPPVRGCRLCFPFQWPKQEISNGQLGQFGVSTVTPVALCSHPACLFAS